MTTAPVTTHVVLVDRHDGVLTMTINRPSQNDDPKVSAGVLTGAGGTFCAGMDLKAFATGELPSLPGRGFGGLTRMRVKKPLIAAVEGWALGGGFELALACDLIVAAEDAQFGSPEVGWGIVPGEGGLVRLPHRLPYDVAVRLLLTAELLPATEAKQYGLVNELTAPGAALQTAMELARRVTRNAPLALAAVKEVLRANRDDAAAFKRQDELIRGLLDSEDAHEGATAFAEKRAPKWRGQ
jgi:enoyl-CoA hydratase